MANLICNTATWQINAAKSILTLGYCNNAIILNGQTSKWYFNSEEIFQLVTKIDDLQATFGINYTTLLLNNFNNIMVSTYLVNYSI
jgi:hypothetical protein